MGSTNSTQTRSVTIENDSPIGVIEVSDDVVQRLKVGLLKAEPKAEAKSPPAREPSPSRPVRPVPQPSPPKVTTIPIQPPPPQPSPPPTFTSARAPTPPAMFHPEPTITSYDVLRQKDNELKNNDLYWKQRIGELEKQYQKQNAIVQDEFNKTYESVKKQFERSSPLARNTSSVAERDRLIKCLEDNLNEPLKCSELADDFTQSVLNAGRTNSKGNH